MTICHGLNILYHIVGSDVKDTIILKQFTTVYIIFDYLCIVIEPMRLTTALRLEVIMHIHRSREVDSSLLFFIYESV